MPSVGTPQEPAPPAPQTPPPPQPPAPQQTPQAEPQAGQPEPPLPDFPIIASTPEEAYEMARQAHAQVSQAKATLETQLAEAQHGPAGRA